MPQPCYLPAAPNTTSTGGWVDPAIGLDAVEKRQLCCHFCNWNCRSLSLQLNNYDDWATPAPKSQSTICHIMQQADVLELLRQAVKISHLCMQMQLSRKCRQLHYLDQPHNLQTAQKLYELTIQGYIYFVSNSLWVKSQVWISVLEKSVTHNTLLLTEAPCLVTLTHNV
jgi:competence CoiA-like predicted nuclease